MLILYLDDYNSWQESWWGRWRRHHLDKDVILAEGTNFPLLFLSLSLSLSGNTFAFFDSMGDSDVGYKEYNMHRKTLNWMGDRHKDKDREVRLDGIGGVSILVKAEVHRSGGLPLYTFPVTFGLGRHGALMV